MGLSFKEASAWTSALVTALVFIPYFVSTLNAPATPVLTLLVPAVIAAVAWQILLHVVLAVRKLPEPLEARDREISARANSIACPVLIAGLAITVGQALFPEWLGRLPALSEVPPRALVINLAVFAIVAAEIVKCAAQIFLYRRAALHGVEG